MDADLLVSILGIALVDSLNPSAIAMTLTLLGVMGRARGPLYYVAGIFLTYLSIGLAVMLGLGNKIHDALDSALAPSPGRYVVEVVGAIALLVLAITHANSTRVRPNRSFELSSVSTPKLLWLGATVTALESTTALPYVAALGLLIRAEPSWPASAGVLVGYNVIFILPPLLIVGLFVAFRNRVAPRLAQLRVRLERPPDRRWVAALMGLGSLLLGTDGVAGLIAGEGWI